MREYIYIILTLVTTLLLFGFVSLSNADNASSPDVKPITGVTQKVMECYGATQVDTSTTWNKELDCNDNQATTSCGSSSSGQTGTAIGYTHTCTGGDWIDPCTNHCYMVCAPSTNPQTNCQWN